GEGGHEWGGVEGRPPVADAEDVRQAPPVDLQRDVVGRVGGIVALPVFLAVLGSVFDLAEEELIDPVHELGGDVALHREGFGAGQGGGRLLRRGQGGGQEEGEQQGAAARHRGGTRGGRGAAGGMLRV